MLSSPPPLSPPPFSTVSQTTAQTALQTSPQTTPRTAPQNIAAEPVHLWSLRGRRWLLWVGWVIVPLVIALVMMGLQWIPPRQQWPGSPSRDDVSKLLARVRVVSTRHHVLGYERSCTGTSACSFGEPWTDNSDAPGSHNGVDTRSDMLRNLSSPLDPYTGQPLPQQRRQKHIDHLFPCLLYTSPSPRDRQKSRMPSSA